MSSIHNQTKETWLIFNVVFLSIYNNVSKNINFKGYTNMSILYSVGQLKKGYKNAYVTKIRTPMPAWV